MNVLFATDGSAPAREGELLVTRLFNSTTPIHTFTVAPELRYEWLGPVGYPELAHMDVPVLGGDQVASEAADRLTQNGFETSSSSSRGFPGVEILRMINKKNFDLVVLGASHRTWLGNLLMGSVSTYVLHHAPCPVLVTHRAPMGTGKVLVGADGSGSAMTSVEMVAEVLDRSRCSVEVATVVDQPSSVVIPVQDHQSIEAEMITRGWQIAERTSDLLRRADFDVSEAVLVGNPGHQLLKEVENLTADLVVVGSRGLGSMHRTFLGSTSDQLVRHAPATLVGRIRQ